MYIPKISYEYKYIYIPKSSSETFSRSPFFRWPQWNWWLKLWDFWTMWNTWSFTRKRNLLATQTFTKSVFPISLNEKEEYINTRTYLSYSLRLRLIWNYTFLPFSLSLPLVYFVIQLFIYLVMLIFILCIYFLTFIFYINWCQSPVSCFISYHSYLNFFP